MNGCDPEAFLCLLRCGVRNMTQAAHCFPLWRLPLHCSLMELVKQSSYVKFSMLLCAACKQLLHLSKHSWAAHGGTICFLLLYVFMSKCVTATIFCLSAKLIEFFGRQLWQCIWIRQSFIEVGIAGRNRHSQYRGERVLYINRRDQWVKLPLFGYLHSWGGGMHNSVSHNECQSCCFQPDTWQLCTVAGRSLRKQYPAGWHLGPGVEAVALRLHKQKNDSLHIIIDGHQREFKGPDKTRMLFLICIENIWLCALGMSDSGDKVSSHSSIPFTGVVLKKWPVNSTNASLNQGYSCSQIEPRQSHQQVQVPFTFAFSDSFYVVASP